MTRLRHRLVRIVASLAVAALLSAGLAHWLRRAAQAHMDDWPGAAQAIMQTWQPDSAIVIFPGYLDASLEKVAPGIAADARLSIDEGADEDAIAARLAPLMVAPPARAFLLVRIDASIGRDASTFDRLITMLRTRLSAATRLTTVLIISHDLVRLNDAETPRRLEAALDTLFGPPRARQRLDRLWVTEYPNAPRLVAPPPTP